MFVPQLDELRAGSSSGMGWPLPFGVCGTPPSPRDSSFPSLVSPSRTGWGAGEGPCAPSCDSCPLMSPPCPQADGAERRPAQEDQEEQDDRQGLLQAQGAAARPGPGAVLQHAHRVPRRARGYVPGAGDVPSSPLVSPKSPHLDQIIPLSLQPAWPSTSTSRRPTCPRRGPSTSPRWWPGEEPSCPRTSP